MSIGIQRTRVQAFPALELTNERVRAVIVPSLGARVWELTDRLRKRQWIWHRPGVPLQSCAADAIYDDVWAGGWEELFPNDSAGQFEGRLLTDHGEWWRTAWDVAEVGQTAEEAVIRLTTRLTVRPVSCMKEFRLSAQSDTLRVRYEIDNDSQDSFHFLFKQHLPIAVTRDCSIRVPGGKVTPVDPAFGTILPGPGPFDWPPPAAASAGIRSLEEIPTAGPSSREFAYVEDLPEGWCRVQDSIARAQIQLSWDGRDLPFLWLFLAYGGWRDCYTAVIEPCTNMPKDLAQAASAGRSAFLAAEGTFRTEVSARLSDLVSDR